MVLNPDQVEIPKEAVQALNLLMELLGSDLVAVYLYGSAVMGGLQFTSDVDILAIVKRNLSEQLRKDLTLRLMLISGSENSARPLEVTVVNQEDVVPWRFPPRLEFMYGEWLRDGFERGEFPRPAINPDLAILFVQARSHGISLYGPQADAVLDPVPETDIRKAIKESIPGLMTNLKGDERNVLLTLARMWVTVSTGEIVSKDSAAEWAIPQLPSEPAALLDLARKAYLGEVDDQWDGIYTEVLSLANDMKSAIEADLHA